MFSKHSKPYDEAATSPSKRFRHNAADLFLKGEVSGARMASLFADAEQAGARSVSDVAKTNRGGHAHRDLLRKLRRRHWPKLYHADVRVWNRRLQAMEVISVPALLPHEVLSVVAGRSNMEALCSREGLSAAARAHLTIAEARMSPGPPILAMGLWLDGTPCNWDRSEGVETIAYSFPGLAQGIASLRLPFSVVMQKHCIKQETLDDLLQVFVWSMKHLGLGINPARRHDGTPFGASEQHRLKMSGKDLPLRALLVEVRADWKCLKDVFRLPGWQENAGCCWRCTADHETRRDCSSTAVWRNARLGHWDMIARWMEAGVTPSPILGCPFFDISIFALDWLHIMDLGVACDFMGNFFKLLLKHKPGHTQALRCQALFRDVVDYYERMGVESRLDNLTLQMLGKDGGPPKLRAKAAEARGLIGFCREQAELLSEEDPVEGAAKQAAVHLDACYFCLHDLAYSHEVMKENSRKFCLLLASLEATAEAPNWRMKPKTHLMQEMCEMSEGNPTRHWTYRDEDFGGSMAATARVRGGRGSARVVGLNVLSKFTARHPVPAIR